jgi:GNAT superfamily N-acetyltransferase
MTLELIPAAHFTMQELTDLYNQTRVDYLVPMPMNVDRLAEYVRTFDIDLSHSWVALTADRQVLGLCMLGVRQKQAWATRLGVLPTARRQHVGSALMDYILESADALGVEETFLEVIKNNAPAHNLFASKGFVGTGEYLVMRRAPHPISSPLETHVDFLNQSDALEKLGAYPGHLTWINACESMQNAADLEGLQIRLKNGGSGWVIYRNTKFTLRCTLSHLTIHTEQGNPEEVGTQLLLNLHLRYPRHDTYAENIYKSDPHLPSFRDLGYFENFSRIEMCRPSAR